MSFKGLLLSCKVFYILKHNTRPFLFYLTALIILSFIISCNAVPFSIIDQNIKLQYPGREASHKVAYYKVALITKSSSNELVFDSTKLENRIAYVRIWDSKKNELNSFKKGDTIELIFTHFGEDFNLSKLNTEPVNIFYHYKSKPKSIIINSFKVIGGPISN